MKRALPRVLAGAMGLLLLTSAYYRSVPSTTMARAANNLLASLEAEQKVKATFQFSDDERLNWHFVPRARKGLPLLDMTPAQRHLAHALLNAGLSQSGYIKTTTIMSLEDVLRVLEKDDGKRRNPEMYYFSVFGTPSDEAVWGYRVEGHHLSLNFTVVKGKVMDSPMFLGANPAEVRQGPREGLRALAAEEDLGRDLLNSLDAGQRKVAVVDQNAYKDILTGASRKASLEGQPSGLSASKLTAPQFEKLMTLLSEYANNVPQQVAARRLEQVKRAGKNLHFAWAGEAQRGGPHYYRVQAPEFLIEYDNTQNGANHIHTVWRDLKGDFGLDLLQEHYKASHR